MWYHNIICKELHVTCNLITFILFPVLNPPANEYLKNLLVSKKKRLNYRKGHSLYDLFPHSESTDFFSNFCMGPMFTTISRKVFLDTFLFKVIIIHSIHSNLTKVKGNCKAIPGKD